MQKQATITSKGQIRCRVRSGECLGFETETNCCSRVMAKGCVSGRLEARARFPNIEALVIRRFRLAETILENGCAEGGGDDHCRRYERDYSVVG